MGSSNETFSKKEQQRKKEKQRKEKAEKMQARKANVQKGKPLSEMMAYIDENGNISDTPPDPKKAKAFRQEDMEIGVPKQAPPSEEERIKNGTVSFFDESKGFGFINDSLSGERVFVHTSQLTERIQEGDKVQFEVEMGFKGPNAVNIKRV